MCIYWKIRFRNRKKCLVVYIRSLLLKPFCFPIDGVTGYIYIIGMVTFIGEASNLFAFAFLKLKRILTSN